jgi:hypothetical protein
MVVVRLERGRTGGPAGAGARAVNDWTVPERRLFGPDRGSLLIGALLIAECAWAAAISYLVWRLV